MLTLLLIATSILLALSGLALIKLSNAYTALNAEYDSLLEEAAQDDATIDQLTTENQELNSELQTTKHNAYHREQELLNALEDATRAADKATNESAEFEYCYNDACWTIETMQREYSELQQELKATVEGYESYYAELKESNNGLHTENMQIHDQLAQYMAAYDAACAELDKAIEAAEEAPIHIDDKKAWICIGNWTRLIVYKHNIYQPYCQHGLEGKIERTKRKDLTTKAQGQYNALKAALKAL